MKLSITAKRMFLVICVSSAVIIVGGAVFYRSNEIFAFALGVFLMLVLNCAKVIMLERAVNRAVLLKDQKSAKWHIALRYILRLALTIGVLALAAYSGHRSMTFGAIAGVFTFQIAAFSLKFFISRDEAKAAALNPPLPESES